MSLPPWHFQPLAWTADGNTALRYAFEAGQSTRRPDLPIATPAKRQSGDRRQDSPLALPRNRDRDGATSNAEGKTPCLIPFWPNCCAAALLKAGIAARWRLQIRKAGSSSHLVMSTGRSTLVRPSRPCRPCPC